MLKISIGFIFDIKNP